LTKKGVNTNELPSFKKIEDEGLRSHNRGAILANIYEVYKGSNNDVLYSLEAYLNRIPEEERVSAKEAMVRHLKQRGYYFDS